MAGTIFVSTSKWEVGARSFAMTSVRSTLQLTRYLIRHVVPDAPETESLGTAAI